MSHLGELMEAREKARAVTAASRRLQQEVRSLRSEAREHLASLWCTLRTARNACEDVRRCPYIQGL